MKKIVLILLSLYMTLSVTLLDAQEFNFSINVNTKQVGGTDQRVYEALQEGVMNFFNNQVWTNIKFTDYERIEGGIVITVKEKNSNIIKGQLNIALRRPIFNSSYDTPIFNYIDDDFTFEYVESQNLDYSESTYMSNLTSTLAFYAYYCLGLYFDTFGLYGGDPFFRAAEQVVNNAQSATEAGWKAFDSYRNRYWLIENMTNAAYRPIRQYMYEYHRLGLDQMSKKVETGRAATTKSFEYLKKIHNEKPSLFFLTILNDTKRDEWKNIYSEGVPSEKSKAINILRELDPSHAEEYEGLLNRRP